MIRFGPSGNDVLFYAEGKKTSVQAPAWLASLGLTAYEVNFGRGIKMGDKMAEELGEQARKHNISVSVHAPYYINLANPDPDALKKSYTYIEQCLDVCRKIDSSDGPHRIVLHIGSQTNLPREIAMDMCKKNIKWICTELKRNGFNNYLLCVETMGRYKAIGTYREICEICAVDPHLVPTLDFGHINCIEQGALQKNTNRFGEIIEHCEQKLGAEKMKHLHIHFSAVKFSDKGEQSHTTLDDDKWAFPFEPLKKVLKAKKLEPVIICESKEIMAQDARKLHDIWQGKH